MTAVRDIIAYIEQQGGRPLGRDEGVHHGSPDAQVRRVVVCWMATQSALEYAGQAGADLLIVHESLYFPYDAAVRGDAPPGWESWPVNRRRRERLEKYALTCMRVHGSLDRICVFDDFARQLGLGEPALRGTEYYVKRYDIAPCTLAALVERVKSAVGMEHVRVSAPRGLAQQVSRVGLPWGGLGLFVNVATQEKLLDIGCDVLIAGEADDYGFRFARDQGVALIETSHEISENAGLRHFTHMLSERFPELTVAFYENTCPWQWV